VYVKGPNLHLAGDKLFGGIGFINKEDSTRKEKDCASEDVRENHSS